MNSSLLNNSTLPGDEYKAKQLMLLRDALMNNPHDAAAWFQLALLIGDPEREIYCLEQVLKIDPGHAGAQDRLKAMFQVTSDAGISLSHAGAWRESRCPFVGLEQDPQSLTSYPSARNFCYRLRQPKSVRLEYQQQYCLSSAYQRCLVYKRGEQLSGKHANG